MYVTTDLQGERVHVSPECDDGPDASAASNRGHDASPGDGPDVGDAERVELCAHELACAVLLEGQLRVLVDAAPQAAQPRRERWSAGRA
jgi:hypothetical protein